MCHPRGLRRSRSTTTTTTSPPPSSWTPFSTPARSNRVFSRQRRDHHVAHRRLDLLEPDLQRRLRHGGAEELQHTVAECDAPEGHRSLQDPDGHPEPTMPPTIRTARTTKAISPHSWPFPAAIRMSFQLCGSARRRCVGGYAPTAIASRQA